MAQTKNTFDRQSKKTIRKLTKTVIKTYKKQ